MRRLARGRGERANNDSSINEAPNQPIQEFDSFCLSRMEERYGFPDRGKTVADLMPSRA